MFVITRCLFRNTSGHDVHCAPRFIPAYSSTLAFPGTAPPSSTRPLTPPRSAHKKCQPAVHQRLLRRNCFSCDRMLHYQREQENRRCDRKHEHHVNSCMPVYSPLCDAVLLAGEQGQDGGEATLKGIRKLFGSREVSVESICLYLLPA